MDDSAAKSNRHRLRAIARPELLHDVFDVYLYSFLGDEQLLGDVPVPVPACNLAENLNLTLGKRVVGHMLG